MIAIDFDGTLSEYHGWKGVGVYGPPVEAMKARILSWQASGVQMMIFTARVAHDGTMEQKRTAEAERKAIQDWLRVNGLPDLHITATKFKAFTEFWDDRAVAVETNTGRQL